MIIVVCPGQGSQKPGFLSPWLEHPEHARLLGELGDAAGLDLVTHGTTSDADTIRDTAVAQPLIVAAGIMALRALLADGRDAYVAGIAGHSVGEITAAAGAGIVTDAEAMSLVRTRGDAMAEAAAVTRTGMSAVVGGDQDAVLARLAELGLEPANFNGGGQIVVAGDPEALAALQAEPLRGTRVIPLQVAGAFHTHHMAPAVAVLQQAVAPLAPRDPRFPIWTNRDGSRVDSGAAFLDLVVGQVASPVRWDLCMEAFDAAGVTGLIEVAPAGALTGLAKRGLKGLPTLALSTPDDLPAAIDMLDAHA
jgi:[acyl-carrier-protein] S-malonyltransferase